MNEAAVTAIKQLSNITAQKDLVLLPLEGTCNANGVFEVDINDTINLTENVSHKISLVQFSGCSFFPNLTEDSNKFYYNNGSVDRTVTLDTGAYNIANYYENVKLYMIKYGDDPKNLVIELNQATGKVHIILNNGYKVYFNKDNTWRNTLGFGAVELSGNNIHVATKIAEVINTYMVYAKCNLCSGTILNGKKSSILFSFPNDKKYGASLTIKPNPIIPVKFVGTKIDKVRIEFSDEDGDPVDFLGHKIFMTLLIEQF